MRCRTWLRKPFATTLPPMLPHITPAAHRPRHGGSVNSASVRSMGSSEGQRSDRLSRDPGGRGCCCRPTTAFPAWRCERRPRPPAPTCRGGSRPAGNHHPNRSWRAAPEEAAHARPGIIHATASLNGRQGPWAGRVGFDQSAGSLTDAPPAAATPSHRLRAAGSTRTSGSTPQGRHAFGTARPHRCAAPRPGRCRVSCRGG